VLGDEHVDGMVALFLRVVYVVQQLLQLLNSLELYQLLPLQVVNGFPLLGQDVVQYLSVDHLVDPFLLVLAVLCQIELITLHPQLQLLLSDQLIDERVLYRLAEHILVLSTVLLVLVIV
jgi:hypothetical protein